MTTVEAIRRTVWECLQYPAGDFLFLLVEVMAGKLTGSLTINFSNGTPAGTIEWKQRAIIPIPAIDNFPL